MSDVYGHKFGLCFSRVACSPWKEDGTPVEGQGKLPAQGWRVQIWLGVHAVMLLAAKPRGEDLPRRRGVYKACRILPSQFLSPE